MIVEDEGKAVARKSAMAASAGIRHCDNLRLRERKVQSAKMSVVRFFALCAKRFALSNWPQCTIESDPLSASCREPAMDTANIARRAISSHLFVSTSSGTASEAPRLTAIAPASR